jgi:aspartokinase/homoserine dehydrogenase 1
MIHILKFGGSSLAEADRIQKAVEIVKKRTDEAFVAVVVSALGGVTNELIQIMDRASSGTDPWEPRYEALRERHLRVARELIKLTDPDVLVSELESLLAELKVEILKIERAGQVTARQRDKVLSFGERLSCRIFVAALREADLPAEPFESQHFVRTNNRFGEADVDFKVTSQLIQEFINPQYKYVPVITGFIGATAENEITTLGRSGSDFTAGIVGEALKAQKIEIWTDVDGVLTADPRVAPGAKTIPRMNYEEIAELSQFGAKVVHPRTVLPLGELNIPVVIKNSFNPDAEGTLITRDGNEQDGSNRLSVSLKKDIGLISIRSKTLDRVEGLFARAAYALYQHGISVTFAASAMSEFSASLAIDKDQTLPAKKILQETFASEFAAGIIDIPHLHFDVSMVSIIGFPLQRDKRISGQILTTLGDNNIIPIAVARGVANRNLSLILPNDQAARAVRLINDHFCTFPDTIRLFIAGVGTIGGELLRQLGELPPSDIRFQIIGACNSTNMIWAPDGIAPGSVKEALKNGEITEWKTIINTLIETYSYRTVFVDCTGSAESAKLYKDLLTAGVHIATPVKIANTINQEYFDALHNLRRTTSVNFLYETTCGAGLPIIQTIEDLIASGDRIDKITGVVSGTMTFIFSELANGASFGESVKKAKALGYTEPDPRDDLSGEDVARKFITLARVAGRRLERSDVSVESLVPAELASVSTEEFLTRIGEYDAVWQARVQEAKNDGKVLRYVAKLDGDKVSVKVEAVPANSPLGTLSGTDNLVAITSKYYNSSPLIIQGPGAGREVTAAGLLADVIKIARRVLF